jgi:large subunit ribosomal protein L33
MEARQPALRAIEAQIRWSAQRCAATAAALELHRERLAIASSSAPRPPRRGRIAWWLLFRRKPSGDRHSITRHYQVRCNLVKSGNDFCPSRRTKVRPTYAEISMGKSKKKAETVFLVCEETGDHNYAIKRKPGGEKLKLKKYSPRLRKHTMHTEKKK